MIESRYTYDEAGAQKIEEKKERNKEKFNTVFDRLQKELEQDPNKSLALTYSSLARGNNGLNGRVLAPFLYLVKNDEDLIVTMEVSNTRNVHHRTPVVRKNTKSIKGYRRIQYDNVGESVIKLLETMFPDGIRSYTHNDILMVISYLLSQSAQVPFDKIEKENYERGNEASYIEKATNWAREQFASRKNQKWFAFNLTAMCAEMLCSVDMVRDVLQELEDKHLLVHSQINYEERLKTKIKEHTVDILHLNLELNEEKREKFYQKCQEDIKQRKHIPPDYSAKNAGEIFFLASEKQSMLDAAMKDFSSDTYDNKVEAKIKLSQEYGSPNVLSKLQRMPSVPNKDANISEYAEKAAYGLSTVIDSVYAQLQQMQEASVSYVAQMSAVIDSLQKQVDSLSRKNTQLQTSAKAKGEQLKKVEDLLTKAEESNQANLSHAQEEVAKYKKKYTSKAREVEAMQNFLESYLANSQNELLDAQMYILSQIADLSGAKRYQLNDDQYIKNFRVNIASRINNLVKTISNYKEEDRVPNVMK